MTSVRVSAKRDLHIELKVKIYVTGDKQSNSGGVNLIYERAFTEKLGQVVRRIMSKLWMSGR